MMAVASPVQGLQEEATCPICLEYYKDPVTTKCGHNFCRACITGCSDGRGTALSCPQCREICTQGDLRTNSQLQRIVELVKQLCAQRKRPREEEEGDGLCEGHDKRLKYFCAEDEKIICVICKWSSDHKMHKVCPIHEAAQEYTIKLEAKRTRLVTKFEKLEQRLKKKKQMLLGRLKEMEKKINKVKNLRIAKLSAEISSFEAVITEIEKTCEQPAGELLKSLSRWMQTQHMNV